MQISQKLTEEGKGGGEEIEIQLYEKISRINDNNKQTADDLHQMACFDLQTALPTATRDISNCSYKSNPLLTILLLVTVRW